MCPFCRASSTIESLAWENCSPDAGWRDTVWEDESYRAFLRESGLAVPALLRHAIGTRIECIKVDVLHTVDLGVGAHIVGNVLFIVAVLGCCFGGRTYAEMVANLFSDMQAWYKRERIAYRLQGALTLERLRAKGDWPKLRAKAAACRELAKYALYLMVTYDDQVVCGKPWADKEMMTSLCQLLVRFYESLASGGMFLGQSAQCEIQRLGQLLADVYTRLARRALADNVKLWKVSPNFICGST